MRHRFHFCVAFSAVLKQTTEDGGEGKAYHGTAEEEDGKRRAADDEERSENRGEALVTLWECSVSSRGTKRSLGKDTEFKL